MVNIESYVFLDIETTGLPWQERNQTKITEISFVAVLRSDLLSTKHGDSPPVSKLTLVFNPMRPIHPDVVRMNGLSNELLQHAPVFAQRTETLLSFLQELPRPVCLVAHNGNRFDFKILMAECLDAKFYFPSDLLCVDSLAAFKNIFTRKSIKESKETITPNVTLVVERRIEVTEQSIDDLMTDDEDEWPNLNVSTEEWDDIDKICDTLSDISCEDFDEIIDSAKKEEKKSIRRSKVISDVFKKKDVKNVKSKESFALIHLYRRLLNREPRNHHRAEEDCLMLLECVVATKEDFVAWVDKNCIKLCGIKPIVRY